MDKRAREDDGEGCDTKRQFLSPLKRQMTPDELEQFQKEAIYRQLNVYRRERDALQRELEVLKSDSKEELEQLRESYLEIKRLEDRPVSGDLTRESKEVKKEGTETTPSSDGGAETEKLKEELAGKTGIIAAHEEQISKMQVKITGLEAKIRDLELTINNPTEEMLAKSVAYKSTAAQVATLKNDCSRLEQDLRAQQQLAADERQKAGNAVFEAHRSSLEQVEELEKKLESSETDISRLRAARDEKISEINVLKAAESTRLASLENLKELQKIAEEKATSAAVQLEDPVAGADIESMGLDELKELATKLAKTNRILSAELPSVEQAYTKAHAKALAKIQDQANIEAKINAAQVSKAKADEKFFSAMRAKDALKAEMERMKTALSKSTDLLRSSREGEAKLHHQVQKLGKQLSDGDQKYSQLQRDLVAHERRRMELEATLSSTQNIVDTLKEQLKVRDSDVAFATEKRRALETKVEKLRRQLEIKRTTSGSGAVQEQLESLRTVALCSLCTNNWKNTAIKVCGHVFCSECTNARLSSRMRKCPLCNSQFGHNDLLTVHL